MPREPINTPRVLLEDEFSVKGGRILVSWPTPLDREDYEDFCAYLEILKRKIERISVNTEAA